jgi:hypothetical protein
LVIEANMANLRSAKYLPKSQHRRVSRNTKQPNFNHKSDNFKIKLWQVPFTDTDKIIILIFVHVYL